MHAAARWHRCEGECAGRPSHPSIGGVGAAQRGLQTRGTMRVAWTQGITHSSKQQRGSDSSTGGQKLVNGMHCGGVVQRMRCALRQNPGGARTVHSREGGDMPNRAGTAHVAMLAHTHCMAMCLPAVGAALHRGTPARAGPHPRQEGVGLLGAQPTLAVCSSPTHAAKMSTTAHPNPCQTLVPCAARAADCAPDSSRCQVSPPKAE